MGLNQIRNLEELSKKVADKSRVAVDLERQELHVLEQQSKELNHINRDYQESIINDDGITPRLLAHRREFVSKLTSRLEALTEQRDSKRQSLNLRISEHSQKSAQHSAIESVCKQRIIENDLSIQRHEQQQIDDSHRGIKHQQKLDKEIDHE